MLENINNIIDYNLKLIFEKSQEKVDNVFWVMDILGENGVRVSQLEQSKIAENMEMKSLITIEPTKRMRIDLTEFGYSMAKIGWENYLKQKIEENQILENKKIEKERIENEKSKIELKLSKWQLKTFWPIFIFGGIGFLLGAYNFLNDFNSKNPKDEKIKDLTNKIEKIYFIQNKKDSINEIKYQHILDKIDMSFPKSKSIKK